MDYTLRPYASMRKFIARLMDGRVTAEHLAPGPAAAPQPWLGPLSPPAPDPSAAGPADLLVRNARVYPADPRQGEPVVVAIKNGLIVHIGSDAPGLAGRDTRIIDAAGGSMIPGLCDAHQHLMVGAEHHQGCNVEDVRDAQTLQRRLERHVRKYPDRDVYYVYGLHYTDPPIIPAGNARGMLDRIVGEKPLFVYAHDLHTGWANTRALKVAGLLERMPPYPEMLHAMDLTANLVLDEGGLPSGELREPPVYFLVEEALRSAFPFSVEQKKSFLEQACHALVARGLTAVHAMGLDLPEEDIECLMLLLELEAEGRLPLRVHAACSVVPDRFMLDDVRRAAGLRDDLQQARRARISFAELYRRLAARMNEALQARDSEKRAAAPDKPLWAHFHRHGTHPITATHRDQYEERLRQFQDDSHNRSLRGTGLVHCKAVKLFMDGVVEKNTAFRLDHHPSPGIPAFSQETLDQVVRLADRLGLQVAAHCIGNGAVNTVLNAVELARRQNQSIDRQRGQCVRHRIEHIELCNTFDIPRFRELEVLASMQALHERPPTTLWHRKVPRNQWSTAFPWRSLVESGAILVFGSDWPIVSCNVFDGIHRAVSRKPWADGLPDQHLELPQALAAFSTNASVADYTEQFKGHVREGMLADLVVLSGNVNAAGADMGSIEVAYTINHGRLVYDAAAAHAG